MSWHVFSEWDWSCVPYNDLSSGIMGFVVSFSARNPAFVSSEMARRASMAREVRVEREGDFVEGWSWASSSFSLSTKWYFILLSDIFLNDIGDALFSRIEKSGSHESGRYVGAIDVYGFSRTSHTSVQGGK